MARSKLMIKIGIGEALLVAFLLWLGMWKFKLPLTVRNPIAFLYYGAVLLILVAPICFYTYVYNLGHRQQYCKFSFIPLLLYFMVILIGGLSMLAIFNARRYASQISIPEALPFAEGDLAPFDPAQIPWIDEAYASVLGDKLIGTLGAVGSSVELGEYVRQDVNGELFFVAPILHAGFWKYNANPSGTQGYVMVSMTDDNDVRLMSDYRIRVQPSGHAAWGDQLERIVWQAAPTRTTCECKFEVDDNLHPWWVVPLEEPQIGLWAGPDITGVVLVDATDGKNVQVYDVDDVPTWVDRIYPSTLIERQLQNWGQYSNGFWNTWFGKVGMLQSDEGNVVVYSNDDCYLFDSLTSYGGADESTVGFVLTNLRTKEVVHFSLAGATEFAACQSALGDERVKAQNYSATFPLPTMIEGRPAYFISLADPVSSIIKSFALVDVEKYQIVGIGTTIREVERDFCAKRQQLGVSSTYASSSDSLDITGEIKRWGAYAQGGNTYYLFVVVGHEDKLLLADASMPEAAITREGDRVKLQAMATKGSSWMVLSFDNLEFTQDVGSDDLELEQNTGDIEAVVATNKQQLSSEPNPPGDRVA